MIKEFLKISSIHKLTSEKLIKWNGWGQRSHNSATPE